MQVIHTISRTRRVAKVCYSDTHDSTYVACSKGVLHSAVTRLRIASHPPLPKYGVANWAQCGDTGRFPRERVRQKIMARQLSLCGASQCQRAHTPMHDCTTHTNAKDTAGTQCTVHSRNNKCMSVLPLHGALGSEAEQPVAKWSYSSHLFHSAISPAHTHTEGDAAEPARLVYDGKGRAVILTQPQTQKM